MNLSICEQFLLEETFISGYYLASPKNGQDFKAAIHQK